MTREELKEHCKRQIQQFERVEKIMPVTPNDWKRYEEHKLILELLEQETVSKEVYDHEYFLRKEFEIKIAQLEQQIARLEQQEPIIDKIRAEIKHLGADDDKAFCKSLNASYKQGLKDALNVLDKYKAESEAEE